MLLWLSHLPNATTHYGLKQGALFWVAWGTTWFILGDFSCNSLNQASDPKPPQEPVAARKEEKEGVKIHHYSEYSIHYEFSVYELQITKLYGKPVCVKLQACMDSDGF